MTFPAAGNGMGSQTRERVDRLALDPQEPEIWFQRARQARTLSEALLYLNQVYALDPQYLAARQMSYRALWRLLEEEPFLAYQGETDQLYRVWSSLNLELIVPKDRAAVEPYPPPETKPLTPVFTFLRWTAVGLIPAGLGALFLAPATAVCALLVYYHYRLNPADQTRIVVVLFWAAVLWMAAVFLSLLFVIHVIA
ncbi:MAG: hypothetical protein L0322_28425 [Chloroflexi bacterium]|nr:hypothetical protein [Chloroflexota bacterium]MCI0575967.1 hypothetical protein [Chloroflexota bacterium]MCI0644404.1 hypothetical protein [Chloroflexota bacterium]